MGHLWGQITTPRTRNDHNEFKMKFCKCLPPLSLFGGSQTLNRFSRILWLLAPDQYIINTWQGIFIFSWSVHLTDDNRCIISKFHLSSIRIVWGIPKWIHWGGYTFFPKVIEATFWVLLTQVCSCDKGPWIQGLHQELVQWWNQYHAWVVIQEWIQEINQQILEWLECFRRRSFCLLCS